MPFLLNLSGQRPARSSAPPSRLPFWATVSLAFAGAGFVFDLALTQGSITASILHALRR